MSGKNKVNPIAMILAVAEALRWVGAKKSLPKLATGGDAIEAAVVEVLGRGEPLTYDLVGEAKAATMSAVGDAVLASLASRLT